MRSEHLLPLVLLATLLLPRPAGAVIVDFFYTLQLVAIDSEAGSLLGFLAEDDLVTGSFRVDTDLAPDYTDGATSAHGDFFTANASIQIHGDDYLPVFGPPFEFLETYDVEVFDGFSAPEMCIPMNYCIPAVGPLDSFHFGIGRDLKSASGVAVDLYFSLTEEGVAATLLDGLGLPASLPFPSGAGVETSGGLLLIDLVGTGSVFASMDLVALASVEVPEP